MVRKNKTLAVCLALLGGALGLHRFYLRGLGDWVGWLHPIPAALGLWGVDRVLLYGQDDKLSWVLIPLLGATIAASCLMAIVYALTDREKWNRQFNPGLAAEAASGGTNWLTIGRSWWLARGHHRTDGQPCLRFPALFRVPGRRSPQDQPVRPRLS